MSPVDGHLTTPTADDYAQKMCRIRLTAVYLTTVHQIIIKVFYLHMKHLATTLKMFIFTINCHSSQHVYITVSNGRVARSV